MEQTIEGFQEILTGKYDHLPEVAFYMVGDISEVKLQLSFYICVLGRMVFTSNKGRGGPWIVLKIACFFSGGTKSWEVGSRNIIVRSTVSVRINNGPFNLPTVCILKYINCKTHNSFWHSAILNWSDTTIVVVYYSLVLTVHLQKRKGKVIISV